MRYQGPNFQEKTLCFLCDFWWAVLFILALLIGLGLTRCLWFQSSCPASILIQNSTPYDLSIVLQGNEDTTITLPECTTCQTYQNTAPITCPTKGSKEKQNLDAGLYALAVSSSENSSDPMPYIAELLITQHKQTSVCLIILDGRIVPVGISEAITESTPEEPDGTETVLPTQFDTPAENETPVSSEWQDYINDDWSFSLKYPNSIESNTLYINELKRDYVDGLEELLLLSNIQDNNFEDPPPEQDFRIIVYQQASANQSFDEWSTQMSSYIGAGQLVLYKQENCEGYSISVTNPYNLYQWASARWIDTGEKYYGIVAQSLSGLSELPIILDSFLPARCKQ